MNNIIYIALAQLFEYPKEGYKENAISCMKLLKANYPSAAESLQRFVDFIENKSVEEIEEIYSITFHIQAICYLDLGYVLFGEDYTRGEFLVNMKREQAKIGHDCGTELADNLPNVLKLMTISKDKEFIDELTVRMLMPALRKMLTEFQASRIELRNKIIRKQQKVIILEDIEEGNIYQNALQALLKVLEVNFAGIDYADEKIEPSLSNLIPNCGSSCSTDTLQTTKTLKS